MNEETLNFFKDKEILVTGGCGSIGSEIVKQLLNSQPKLIKVFDNNEGSLFNLSQDLSQHANVRYLMGDVRDYSRLIKAVHCSDIVFHAAALKHVPISEYNPFEAVATNVIGTQNILDASRVENVERVITISTDKAVNPISTMGATKLLSEKLTLNAPLGKHKTIFSCVRFGNVLDSNGSIIPLVRTQIKQGKPVTITDEKMTRFFMPLPDAVSLVLRAAQIMNGREVFILKMKSLKIKDLIDVLIENIAPKHGMRPEEVQIKVIGKRHGERLHEYLMFEDEVEYVEETDDLYIINHPILSPHFMEITPKTSECNPVLRSDTNLMNKEEIKNLLFKWQII